MQEFLPNTYPVGATQSVPGVPGRFRLPDLERQLAPARRQLQLRRRLRNGLTATVQYTLAKATDDAARRSPAASIDGSAIAQDWRISTPSGRRRTSISAIW